MYTKDSCHPGELSSQNPGVENLPDSDTNRPPEPGKLLVILKAHVCTQSRGPLPPSSRCNTVRFGAFSHPGYQCWLLPVVYQQSPPQKKCKTNLNKCWLPLLDAWMGGTWMCNGGYKWNTTMAINFKVVCKSYNPYSPYTYQLPIGYAHPSSHKTEQFLNYLLCLAPSIDSGVPNGTHHRLHANKDQKPQAESKWGKKTLLLLIVNNPCCFKPSEILISCI